MSLPTHLAHTLIYCEADALDEGIDGRGSVVDCGSPLPLSTAGWTDDGLKHDYL